MSYRVGVDIGGTFTDVVFLDEDTGKLGIAKAFSTPANPIQGITEAIKKTQVDFKMVSDFVHGTTVATNTVIQRKGAKVGLITTQGFRDTLEIMRCNRKYHYDLQWDKPVPLVPRHLRLEVPERMDYRGRVIKPLDEESARAAVKQLRREGVDALAICFIFSFMNPDHERRMKEIVHDEWPDVYVSLSSEILPEIREYERTSTVAADAYVKPLMDKYFHDLSEGLRTRGFEKQPMIMCSSGGVWPVEAARRTPVVTLSSGPAGGVIGTVFWGQLTGVNNLLSIDMGGTSFDVSLVDGGTPRYTTEGEIEWGLPFKIPMINVKSIGAGGGSIAWIDPGGLLQIGPVSAGSNPGPVCYGRGGVEPTVTDAYVALGVIAPDYFLGGEIQLDKEAAERAILERIAKPLRMSLLEAAAGIVEIAKAGMEGAMRNISIEQGYDPRDFAVLAYGGAGPLVAGDLAHALGAPRVIVPMYPGAFSALGMLAADMRFDSVRSYLSSLVQADVTTINQIYTELQEETMKNLSNLGYEDTPILLRSADLRYVGQNYEVNTPVQANGDLRQEDIQTVVASFNREHDKLYAHHKSGEPVELVSLRLTAIAKTTKPMISTVPKEDERSAQKGRRRIYFKEHGEFIDCPIYERLLMPAGAFVPGPAIIEEQDSTIVVGLRQSARVDGYGSIIIES